MPEPVCAITVRLAAEDAARVDAIVQAVPLSNRHAVMKAATRVGLRHLEVHPHEVIALLREQGGRVMGG
jgi:hypothetical protein